MYNHLLDTFRAVAEEGSFTKAGERLYISHTAVRKQINQLEDYLGVRLLVRSKAGVSLNPAGKALYAGALRLMGESDQVIEDVQRAYFASPRTLRVGSSNLYPCYRFMDLWDNLNEKMSGWQLEVVPIGNDDERLRALGGDYDFVVGPYDSFPEGSPYEFRQMGTYRFVIAIPRQNPLAKRESLSLADLAGQPLMIMREGTSPANDAIRHELHKSHPDVTAIDIEPHYSLQTFNRCVETGSLLLSLECWDRVHPGLKSVVLQGDHALPYGLVYRKDSSTMREFVDAIAAALT